MDPRQQRLNALIARIDAAANAAGRPAGAHLLAVSKTQPAAAIRALAALGQRAFGENYVQEAIAKQTQLRGLDLEWHSIGHLQSNKAREAAEHFDWVQSIDRPSVIDALARHRAPDAPPLNLLIQVNIDDETSKSGCAPEQIDALAARIREHPNLRLRGLMCIPAADVGPAQRSASFERMRAEFARLQKDDAGIDTLSMGMSDDFEQAIAHGATLVRIGTALFGARA